MSVTTEAQIIDCFAAIDGEQRLKVLKVLLEKAVANAPPHPIGIQDRWRLEALENHVKRFLVRLKDLEENPSKENPESVDLKNRIEVLEGTLENYFQHTNRRLGNLESRISITERDGEGHRGRLTKFSERLENLEKTFEERNFIWRPASAPISEDQLKDEIRRRYWKGRKSSFNLGNGVTSLVRLAKEYNFSKHKIRRICHKGARRDGSELRPPPGLSDGA